MKAGIYNSKLKVFKITSSSFASVRGSGNESTRLFDPLLIDEWSTEENVQICLYLNI